MAKPADSNTGNVQVPSVLDPSGFENQRPQSGKQRADSLKIEGEDYFMSSPRFPAASSNSAPTSPASMSKYNVSFSPRITFHDAWPKTEYDRRGDIATCNRLTPMLAQQIKEELNTFKMVCSEASFRKIAGDADMSFRRWMFTSSPKFIRIFSNELCVRRGVFKAFLF